MRSCPLLLDVSPLYCFQTATSLVLPITVAPSDIPFSNSCISLKEGERKTCNTVICNKLNISFYMYAISEHYSLSTFCGLDQDGFNNTPISSYASVPANNNLKLVLMLSCAIHLLYFLAQLSTNLDHSGYCSREQTLRNSKVVHSTPEPTMQHLFIYWRTDASHKP